LDLHFNRFVSKRVFCESSSLCGKFYSWRLNPKPFISSTLRPIPLRLPDLK
jgi:hypothetical protein